MTSTRLFCTAMPNRPIRPTSDDTFQVSPAASSARMPPTNAIGTVTRISDASTAEPSAMFSSTNTPKSAAPIAIVSARDARAWLSTRPAEIEEVAARQLQLAPPAAARTSAAALPRSRPVTDASTAMRRVPASRRIDAGPERLLNLAPAGRAGSCVPSWPSISSVRMAVEVVAAVVPQADDQVEAALPDPDLRRPPRRPGRCARARITSPGASPTRAAACAVDRDLQLRQAGQRLGAQVGRCPSTPAMIALGLLRQPRQLVEVRAEDRAPRCRRACRRGPRRCASPAAS